MKQKHLNVALGVVALAMVGGVMLAQKKSAPKAAPLTTLDAAAIERIAIKYPGKPEIDLAKKDGAWALTQPVAIAADPFEVQSLTALASSEERSTIDDLTSIKLADFGLDPAGFEIVLNDTPLDFGGVEPLRYQRYVKTAGHIALIDDPQSPALDSNYSDLVSKRLLPEGAEIAKIEVPGLVVARAPAGPGWTSLPVDAAASSDRLQKFADAWREARATWNQAVSAMEPPPKAPTETAVLTLKDGSVLSFIIASRSPQLVLERSDLKLRYNLPQTAVEQLLQLPPLKPTADHDAAGGNGAVPALPGVAMPGTESSAAPAASDAALDKSGSKPAR